jgi:predicted metal-dependent peptidase
MNDLNNKLMQANEIASSKKAGSVPAFVPIMLKEFKEPQIDWRVYLNSFIQENIVDYSFCPPDTRFQDSDFILPSFSEKDEEVNNILFMVDVSGSMSVDEITSCFSEIQAAIIQFNGKLKGYIGFFDAEVKDVYEFDGDTILHDLKIGGGGGTNFQIIFDYINKNMKDELPNTLIILTDGYADFPSKKDQPSYPVLWVINNKEVTPPWGQFTRILK